MNLDDNAYGIRSESKLRIGLRLCFNGIYSGFWKLAKETRKFHLNPTFHINRILTSGIQSKKDLVFIAENICKTEFIEVPSSEMVIDLLTAFETVLNLDIKNVKWFMEELCFIFPDFTHWNISFDPEKKQDPRVYEIHLRKKLGMAFKEISKNNSVAQEKFAGITESLFALVIVADFTIPDTFREKLNQLLRKWI